MKKYGKIIVGLSVICGGIFFASYTFRGSSQVKEEVMLNMLTGSLNSAHFSPKDFNDDFSGKLFDLYIERMDYTKKFFLQEDVDAMAKWKLQIDNQIKDGKFDFFTLSYDLITKRTLEAEVYYKDILSKPFDFSADEEIETDSKKVPFPKTKDELKESWRKSLKYQVLTRVASMMDEREKKDSLNKDFQFTKPLLDSMESSAREKVLRSNDDLFKRITRFTRADRYNTFLNCIANVFDPHTEFFPPKDKKNFDIQMSGQLEGIGAQLQEKDGAIKVSSIVPGSASWKQGQLKAGDVIVKVAQGSKDPVDVSDWKLDDAIELIRGKKGTEVRLTVKKPDGSIIVIPIIRDVVILEETYAHSVLINKGKQRIGYINLPSFYADFEQKGGGRSCSQDVRRELEKLGSDTIGGIILDLRNNGGGSLRDVIKMAGLFIKSGPVVQVMQRGRKNPEVYYDDDDAIVYDGPLLILVNENSASASEIMAAAIQDYKRGIIVGSNTTFGKGTVQQFISLDDYVLPQFDTVKPLGALKLTIQKFYRINGGSTQLRGVVPDIILPDVFKYIDEFEGDLDNPLPWDETQKANYKEWTGSIKIDDARKKSQSRVKVDPRFQLIDKWSLELKKDKEDSKSTLNITKYRVEEKERIMKNKQYDLLQKEITDLYVKPLSIDKKVMDTDSLKVRRYKDFQKVVQKDIYILEAMNILSDMKK
jgi:carboxyl-terminal processing protease